VVLCCISAFIRKCRYRLIKRIIQTFVKQDWQFLLAFYEWKYKKKMRPVQRRNGKTFPEDTTCPRCDAPHHYIYDNNGGSGQYQCKICAQTFVTGEQITKTLKLKVLIVAIPFLQRNTESSSSFISVPTISVLTTFTISNLLILRPLRTKKSLSISFITSTVNSPWIFSPWT